MPTTSRSASSANLRSSSATRPSGAASSIIGIVLAATSTTASAAPAARRARARPAPSRTSPVPTEITGADVNRWYLGYDQAIDAAGTAPLHRLSALRCRRRPDRLAARYTSRRRWTISSCSTPAPVSTFRADSPFPGRAAKGRPSGGPSDSRSQISPIATRRRPPPRRPDFDGPALRRRSTALSSPSYQWLRVAV